MKRRRRKNLLRGLILSFAVAAIVIPTAQARVSNYNPSAQSQQSLTDINQIQRQLEAQKIQRLIKQEEQEKASASRRPDDRAGLPGPGAVDVRTVEAVSVKGDGFSWADAGIGAGMAIAFLLALLSGLAVTRRRQSEPAV